MDIFKNYNEYLDSEILDESLSFDEKIEKFKAIEEKNSFRFGIIVATYKRKDGTTPQRLTEAIESIKNQKYQNFKIYLMGDYYEDPSEIKHIQESFDPNKFLFENVSVPGERFRFYGKDLWHSGSNFVANIAINKAIRDGMTHMSRLDHDDVWLPNHLSNVAKALTKYPKAKFVSTTAMIKRFIRGEERGIHYTRPEMGKVKHIGYNNLRHLTESWHSTIVWDLKTYKDLRYRNVREQKLSEPVRVECRGGDRDLIDRIKSQSKEFGNKWINLPIITMLYRNKMGELPEHNEYIINKENL